MSFNYALTANQQTPTSDSKTVLCKSFKIDIAAGSGFTSGSTYDLGWLPKDAQMLFGAVSTATAVSGGTVSVATLGISIGGLAVTSGLNVFASSGLPFYPGATYMNGLASITVDQKITYTPTLTGSGATIGVMYVTIYYVV